MAKILFSIPVHERPDIVRDQIENINYFCPGSVVCIHISSGATVSHDEFRRHCDFENVLINPQSYETIWSGGIMHTHVSNFLYALECGVEFDKVLLASSNELLVKPGLSDYVAGFTAGAQMEVYDSATDWGVFRADFLESPAMQKFVKALDLPLFFGGQAEGQFFDKDVFAWLSRLFVACFPMGPCGFPIEEAVPATIAARLAITGQDVALPVTLCNYCNNLTISNEVVLQVRKGTGALFAKRVPRALRSPHIGASVLKGVFGVKRVPREDCELRRFIRGLMT
ncbi:MAG: hypothetical protein QM775_25350 [Pirellulales bacterium]